jgi:two-component system, cell cycle sensor histidine kinase PleC
MYDGASEIPDRVHARARVAIDHFVRPVAPVPPDMACATVYDRFVADRELLAVPVCAEARVVGMVDRYDFLRQLAHSYGRALFDRKPVATLMDTAPLVVDRGIDILDLQRRIALDHPSALIRGFAVTADGRYAGYGDALALLRAGLAESSETNRRLEAALGEARSANRVKSLFFANLSHELRTPLNAIIGFSEVMSDAIFGPLAPRYRDYAGDILTSGRHLLELINDLLDMAKIEAGEMRADPVDVDVDVAIQAAVRLVRDQAQRGRVALSVGVEPGLPILRTDARHFRQMLINLLSNAVKFTRKDGQVSVFAGLAPGGGLMVGVRDTGIGMSPADLELAMRPFGQVANETTRAHDGTGLGLPLVKALAELNGAEFALDSAPGRGTLATLRFGVERVRVACQALSA